VSSLAVSLLLLIVLAVAVALVYNLQQSSRTGLKWPAWLRLPQRAHGAGDRAPPRAGEVSGRTSVPPPPPGSRGEPRLGAADSAGEAPQAGHDRTAPAGAPAPAAFRADEAQPAGDTLDDAPSGAAYDPQEEAGVTSLIDTRTAADDGAVIAATSYAPRTADLPAAATAPGSGPAGAGAGSGPPVLSEVFDCIVEIPLPSAGSGERLLALTQRFRRAGAKPVAVEGRVAGVAAQAWGALVPAHQYDALRVGILMANRHGALNAMEYSDFVSGVQAIADALSAPADIPDMAAVLARARDLDATCAQLDAQVGVNVEAPEALGPAQLAALAGPLSVVERGSNRYARLGPQGEVVFSVALADVPSRLTFLLDVPRSSPAWDAWDRMVEAANACAQRLGGRIVDDGGRALAEASLAQVGRQLSQRYESLEAIGVPAGSALALRVFN
jgi:hypothetical protein